MAAPHLSKNITKTGAQSRPACGTAGSGCQTGSLGKMGERQVGVAAADSLVGIHSHLVPSRRGVRSKEEGRIEMNARRKEKRRGRGERGRREKVRGGGEEETINRKRIVMT